MRGLKKMETFFQIKTMFWKLAGPSAALFVHGFNYIMQG